MLRVKDYYEYRFYLSTQFLSFDEPFIVQIILKLVQSFYNLYHVC